jgi:hypothetical protein
MPLFFSGSRKVTGFLPDQSFPRQAITGQEEYYNHSSIGTTHRTIKNGNAILPAKDYSSCYTGVRGSSQARARSHIPDGQVSQRHPNYLLHLCSNIYCFNKK